MKNVGVGNIAMSAVVIMFLILSPRVAEAYIDPGMGSLVIQSLIAIAAAVALSVRVFWSRIRSFFVDKKKTGKTDDEEQTKDEQEQKET